MTIAKISFNIYFVVKRLHVVNRIVLQGVLTYDPSITKLIYGDVRGKITFQLTVSRYDPKTNEKLFGTDEFLCVATGVCGELVAGVRSGQTLNLSGRVEFDHRYDPVTRENRFKPVVQVDEISVVPDVMYSESEVAIGLESLFQ